MRMRTAAGLVLAGMLLLGATPARAGNGKIIIHDGGVLSISSGRLELNCGQLLVESGGEFIADGSRIVRVGRSRYEPDSAVRLSDTLFYRCPQPWLRLLDVP